MWNVIFSALSVLSFLLWLAVAFFVARIAIRLRELQDRSNLCSLSRVKSIETSLAETQDALAVLTNRFKMTKVRNAAVHVPEKSGEPDPFTEPDRWRTEMNKKLSITKQR